MSYAEHLFETMPNIMQTAPQEDTTCRKLLKRSVKVGLRPKYLSAPNEGLRKGVCREMG
jgi:deoxyxylulose-5-phosphate synthase